MSNQSSFFLGLTVTVVTFAILLFTFGSIGHKRGYYHGSPYLQRILDDNCCHCSGSQMGYRHGFRHEFRHNSCPNTQQELDSVSIENK
jgi:hypothetical protein